MTYDKHVWVDNEVIETDEMNNIEDGILDAHELIETHGSTTTGVHGALGRVLGSNEIGIPNGIAGLNDLGALELESDELPQIFLQNLSEFGSSIHTYYGLFSKSGMEFLANAYYSSGVWTRFTDGLSALSLLMDVTNQQFTFRYTPAGTGTFENGDWEDLISFGTSGNLTIAGILDAAAIDITGTIYAGSGISGLTLTSRGDLSVLDLGLLKLFKDATRYIGFQAPSGLLSSYELTLPTADGESGQALITDGSGQLSWGDAGTSGETAVGNIDGGRADSIYTSESLIVSGGGAAE